MTGATVPYGCPCECPRGCRRGKGTRDDRIGKDLRQFENSHDRAFMTRIASSWSVQVMRAALARSRREEELARNHCLPAGHLEVSHGGADPGSNHMRTDNKNTSTNDLWTNASTTDTWRDIVTKALIANGEPVPLKKLYELVEPHPKAQGKKWFRARLRETLESSPTFTRVAQGVWDLSSRHSDAEVSKFETLRRERYPKLPRES